MPAVARPDPSLVRRAAERSAPGRAVVSARLTGRSAIAYDPYLAGRTVEHVTGVALTDDGGSVEWTAVVKRTTGDGLRAARRELAAYRARIAHPGPGGVLGAPALLAWAESADHVELWLEELADEHGGQWPVARFEVAARHIATWDCAPRAVPPGFDSEDAWAERHGQPDRVPEALARLETHRSAPGAPALMRLLADPGFTRTEALIATTAQRIAVLATFPHTLLHHDLVRSNLFALTPSSTAAIDWENVGRGPLGVDLAPLVAGSVRRGEASAHDLPALEDAVVSGFADGLRRAGTGDVRLVRPAYRLALGLRWHTVLGTIGAWLDPTVTRIRGSRPAEPRAESLEHLLALSRYLLAAADEPSATTPPS